ncbi:universal stress protein [candidate division KSB1 bacterium]|nr:universal stress protein [candidate division KSB1 bacterium]
MRLSKILCPIDFSSCSVNALRHALSFASDLKSEIHVFHAILMHEQDSSTEDENVPDFRDKYDLLEKMADKKLSDLLKHEHGRHKIKYVSRRGFSAAEEILRYLNDESFDLVIMGTHSGSLMREFLLGSVAEKIIRLAPIPVMTVREKSVEPDAYKRILVPIDYSDYSRDALKYSIQLSGIFKSTIVMLHVIQEEIHPSFYKQFGGSFLDTDLKFKEHAVSEMKKMREHFNHESVPTEFAVSVGESAREIISFTDDNDIDLIVIATHGLTGLKHYILGSTTERVIHTSTVPTLVMR